MNNTVKKNTEHTVFYDKIALSADNFIVKWDGDENVKIVISGDEQEAETMEINFH